MCGREVRDIHIIHANCLHSPPRPQEAGPLILIGAVGEDLLKEVVETHQPHLHLAHDVILLQLSIVTGFGDTLRQKYKRIDVIIDNTKYYIEKWMEFCHRYNSDWETFVEVCELIFEANLYLDSQPKSHTRTHACTHAHTHARTHTHASMHACTNVHMYVCMYVCMYIHIYTCIHTHTHTHTHTHSHTHTHTHTHTQTHTCTHTYMHKCLALVTFFMEKC